MHKKVWTVISESQYPIISLKITADSDSLMLHWHAICRFSIVSSLKRIWGDETSTISTSQKKFTLWQYTKEINYILTMFKSCLVVENICKTPRINPKFIILDKAISFKNRGNCHNLLFFFLSFFLFISLLILVKDDMLLNLCYYID